MSNINDSKLRQENISILGLYDSSTGTFYKPENSKIERKLWEYYREEEKREN